MQSFNFSKYTKNSSFTGLSPLDKLDPQTEWEQKHGRRITREGHPPRTEDSDSFSSLRSSSSEWNSEKSNLLDAEVDKLLKSTAHELQGRQCHPVIKRQSPHPTKFRSADGGCMSPALNESRTGFGSFRDVVISNFSDEEIHQNDGGAMNENHNRGPNDQVIQSPPTTMRDDYKSWTPTNDPVLKNNGAHSRASSMTPMVGDTSRPGSSHYAGSEADTPRYQPRPIIMLDEDNSLRPVTRSQELQTLTLTSDDGTLPSLPPNIEVQLQRFRHIPVDRVMHYANTGSYVDHIYNNEHLYDVIVRIGDKIFTAHRVVLSCYSSYFAELFAKMNENIRVPLEIRLKGVHPDAFSIFLAFAYTGEINILPELVPDIMKMSENLRIYTLRMKCLDYMDLLPCNDILLLVANFRETQESEIFVRAMKYVNKKFDEVISCDIFLLLDIETVCFLLSYDHLVACTEMDIFKAGLRWIEFKLHERSRYLERILECIRLTLMTMDELFLVVRAIQALTGDDRGRDIILRTNWILTAYILGREDPYKFPEHKVRTELKTEPSSTGEPFYSEHAFLPVDVEIGSTRASAPPTPQNQNGHAHHPLVKPEDSVSDARTTRTDKPTSKSSAYALNVKKDSVIRRDAKPQIPSDVKPARRSVETRTGDIFAVGDFRKYSTDKQNREVKIVEQYDSAQNVWSHVTVLPEPRLHHAITMLDGRLYLVGGTDPRKSKQSSYDFPTKEAFVYDANTNAWRQIAPMNTARMYHSLCSLYGMIYAIGGQGERKRILNTVECYNPATNNWFFVKSMNVSRIGACAADLDGKLYVAGGTGNTVDNMPSSVLSSVECYDPHTNRWSTKHDLRFGRCHANLVKAGGRLYICGGATRTFTRMESTLSSVGVVDAYDTERDMWVPVAQMATPRHNAGCTVVDDNIYIIGGVSTVQNQILQSVECYDVINDVWMDGISELPYQAQWITCAAVRRSK